MREILGEVLGSNFKNISLNSYNKALKKVEDKEDYETGKQALKLTAEEQDQEGLEENQGEENPFGQMDQVIDMDKISSVLPPIFIYGLKMIDIYSGNFDAFKDDDLDNDGKSKKSGNSGDEDSSNSDEENLNQIEMKPPHPLDRKHTLDIIKEEKDRFEKHYGFV